MAIDTAAKRSSAITPSLPWRGVLPIASGTIDAAERQAAARLYSGILASVGTNVDVYPTGVYCIAYLGSVTVGRGPWYPLTPGNTPGWAVISAGNTPAWSAVDTTNPGM